MQAESCARCSSEMPPSKQVNGHLFTIRLIVWGSPQSQNGEAMNPIRACCCGTVPRPFGTCLADPLATGQVHSRYLDGRVIDRGLVLDVDGLVLPTCAPEVMDGQGLIRAVRPPRTSRFQSWSGVKVNIGEQREFRLASCPDNHF